MDVRRNKMKTALFILLGVGILGAGYSIQDRIQMPLPTNLCGDDIKGEVFSPDGKYVATVYIRDCGATTSDNTTVNIRETNEKFDGGEGRVMSVEGEFPVAITWPDSSTLQIKCDLCPEEDMHVDRTWKDIQIISSR
jgi:hypothetical protein